MPPLTTDRLDRLRQHAQAEADAAGEPVLLILASREGIAYDLRGGYFCRQSQADRWERGNAEERFEPKRKDYA